MTARLSPTSLGRHPVSGPLLTQNETSKAGWTEIFEQPVKVGNKFFSKSLIFGGLLLTLLKKTVSPADIRYTSHLSGGFIVSKGEGRQESTPVGNSRGQPSSLIKNPPSENKMY